MSPARRDSSVSFASSDSSRRRWRMSCCERVWSDHTLGSAILVSISASWLRSEAASKIAPQVRNFVADGGVFAFQFFYHKSRCRWGFNQGAPAKTEAHKHD